MTSSPIGANPRRRRASIDPRLVDLERSLEGLFRLGANRRFEAIQAQAVGADVTRAGYAVLRSLHDRGPSTVRQVAEASSMDAATASRQVSQLVEIGVVDRRANAEDSRSVVVELTTFGREVYRAIVEYRLRVLASVVGEWSDEDRETMTRLVDRLAGGLSERLGDR